MKYLISLLSCLLSTTVYASSIDLSDDHFVSLLHGKDDVVVDLSHFGISTNETHICQLTPYTSKLPKIDGVIPPKKIEGFTLPLPETRGAIVILQNNGGEAIGRQVDRHPRRFRFFGTRIRFMPDSFDGDKLGGYCLSSTNAALHLHRETPDITIKVIEINPSQKK